MVSLMDDRENKCDKVAEEMEVAGASDSRPRLFKLMHDTEGR